MCICNACVYVYVFMCYVGTCMPLNVHGGERMMSGVIMFQAEPPVHCPRLADLKPLTVPFLCFYFHLTKAVGTVAVCCYICLHPDSGIYSSLWCYTESALPAEPSPGLRCIYYSITH